MNSAKYRTKLSNQLLQLWMLIITITIKVSNCKNQNIQFPPKNWVFRLGFWWENKFSKQILKSNIMKLLNIDTMFFHRNTFNPIWHGRGFFYPLVLFGSDFVSWIFFKNFQTFLEVKIDINRVILTPCPAHWVL